ncbi:MAG: alpha/beta hydrolase [Alphaproteobacteria bacterium]|nr:alpha/beta hydrolase [Alphaproteobacteria bacterium]
MSIVPFSPRFITARDGTRLRTAVFEADPVMLRSDPGATPGEPRSTRGVCVLLHGQTEFIEKYFEVIGELQARGFTVATFDWRGQGGSARLLGDPLTAHIADFAQYDDDLASFLEQIVKPISPRPPLALAHSMGAHNLLRTLHDRPGAFSAAALTAPMLAIATRGYPAPLARAVTALQYFAGQSDAFAWGMAARDPFLVNFDTQLVTSDRARFARTQDFLKQNPPLRLAGPSWGWIEAAYRSMEHVMAPGFAEAIHTPVLICGAGKDRIVRVEAERAFARRLPHGTYVELADAEHEILQENDSIRARFWQAFDDFAGE